MNSKPGSKHRAMLSQLRQRVNLLEEAVVHISLQIEELEIELNADYWAKEKTGEGPRL